MTQQRTRTGKFRKGIIILPSAFTLANLFFGLYAIIATTRGDFIETAWFIVWAAIIDLLDGRIARATRTGSRLGAELDSLVDAVSFGVAPAFIMYTLYFSDGNWSWILPLTYLMAVVVRLARFNVEQAGEPKRYFHGLPCPTPGIVLATFYPFSQTPLFQEHLFSMPWARIIAILLIGLSALMLSNIPYALVPKISLRSTSGVFTSLWIIVNIAVAISIPSYYFFPALLAYTLWGLSKSVILGLLERLPEKDPLLEIVESEDEETRAVEYGGFASMETQQTSTHHQPRKMEGQS